MLEDYNSSKGAVAESSGAGVEDQKLLPYLSFNLRRGDVLQVFSRDKTYLQVYLLKERKIREIFICL